MIGICYLVLVVLNYCFIETGHQAWKQNSSGLRTYFVYDGGDPVLGLSGVGAVVNVFTFGGNGLLSQRINGVDGFLTFDPSGNTVQSLSSSQSVNYSHLVTGFGSQLSGGSTSDAYDGMGAQWGYRRESGNLFLLGHRYYSSQRGQFLTRDPIGYGGGVNLYGYTKNNPINREDNNGFEDRSNSPQSGKFMNYSSSPIAVIFDKPDATGHRIEWKMIVPPGYETNPAKVDIDDVPGPWFFPWRHIPGNHHGLLTCKAYNAFGPLGGPPINIGPPGLPMRQDKDGFPVDLLYGTPSPILNRSYGNDPKQLMLPPAAKANGFIYPIPK